tara:strand:- start:277 stop:561 length:285 start_codon:yes stop_codon:yes gene_type:complete
MMGQFSDKVEKQRLLLEAEEWAKGVKGIHCHSLSSMWYDTRPKDTENGKSVCDRMFNDGLVERTLDNGAIVYIGKQLTGEELVMEFERHNAERR